MSNDPAKVLALLFAIKPEQITCDLRAVEGQLPQLARSIASLHEIPLQKRTPANEAQLAHHMMIQAHALCRQSHVLPEFKIFYASFGAGHIVQMAETVAHDQGRLAELERAMAEIRTREGLAKDEFWFRHRGPAEHRALELESDKIEEGIVDAVFTSVLRRYALHEQADLYENDRVQWEILREIGSRVVSGASDGAAEAAKFVDAYLAKKHGPGVVTRIHTRVAEIKRLVQRTGGG